MKPRGRRCESGADSAETSGEPPVAPLDDSLRMLRSVLTVLTALERRATEAISLSMRKDE